ncbi:MAG: DUF1801 domain-containing protein [Acidobacteria bacterium]|nr:MAG: DUF1801 domain-containing protein [Acidobacteriota bacterium]
MKVGPVRSSAKTVDEYLAEIEPDKRAVVSEVRDVVNENLPAGYEETMEYGIISWSVPIERFSDTYNSRPLMYAALAAQKRYVSLYLMCTYSSEEKRRRFEERLRASGSKAGLGKSCVTFKTIDDLPLDLVTETIASTEVDEFVADYEAATARRRGDSDD